LLSPFWIQRESLWIDEAGSAVKTLASTPAGVWQELLAEKNSNLHLPVYHYYLWACSKLFGHSEFVLRWCNVPWALLGFVFLVLGARRSGGGDPSQGTWLALFLVTSPFLFYYTNEVRPYAMQFGLAAVAFTGMMNILAGSRNSFWSWSMAWGTTLLAWTTVYGLAWWLINLCLWFWRPGRDAKEPQKTIISGFLLVGGTSAILFHAWVVNQGALASPVGQTGWASLAYAVCEWTGAAGFLPGRTDLRSGSAPALPGLILPSLTVILCLTLLFIGCAKTPKTASGALLPGAWMLPSFGIMVSGFLKNFRVLGRHFTPISASFFWLLSLGPSQQPKWHWHRMAGWMLLALWLGSVVRFATHPQHRKDDYRAATQYIANHREPGQGVWWAADAAGARFYSLGNAETMMSPSFSTLDSLPRPDWIALSKPDIYDGNGAIRDYLAKQPSKQVASFQSFVLYRVLK